MVTFTVKDTKAETVTYTATDSTDSITVTPTAAVTFTAGAVNAGKSTVTSSPASVVADGSTTSTITVTLLDVNSNPVSGKTVSLTAGSGSSTISAASGASNASGVVTFTVKDTVVESVTYTAKDTTDNITITQTAAVAFTNPAPTLTGILPTSGTLNTSPSVVLTGSNFISGVSSVSFGSDITVNSTTVNSSTQIAASITIPAAATVGAHDVSVTNAAPGGGTATLTGAFTVNKAATNMTVISSENPSTYEDPVTFTATVSSANGTPTGSVTFYAGSCGGTLLAGPTALNGSGQAAFQTSALTAGSHSIFACYTPTGIYSASSGSMSQQVNAAVLTVTATSSYGTYGQPLPSLAYTMTGFVGSDTQGSATGGAPNESYAVGVSPTSTPGVYGINISLGSLTSANYTFQFVGGYFTMQQAPSTVAATALNSSLYPNQATTLTATVTFAGSGAAPSGTVAFWLNYTGPGTGTLLGTTGTLSPLDATDSTATLTLNASQLAAGANLITAVYGGDTNYGGSTSTAIAVTLLSQLASFGSVNVGTAATEQTLTYSFTSATTLTAVNVLTAGASGLDYTEDVANSTCTALTAYNAGDRAAQ